MKREVLVLLFLAIEGKEDIKSSQIRMDMIFIYGVLGFLIWGYEKAYSVGWLVGGCLVGIFLIIGSKIDGLGIGEGDG